MRTGVNRVGAEALSGERDSNYMATSDLPPVSAHGIIRCFGLAWFLKYPQPELWESGKRVLQRFPSLPFFGKRLFHSSLFPAPQTRSASDIPDYCAGVPRCNPSSMPRSSVWHRTDCETSSRSSTLPAAAHGNSPPARTVVWDI